jgi:hypothetical protein
LFSSILILLLKQSHHRQSTWNSRERLGNIRSFTNFISSEASQQYICQPAFAPRRMLPILTRISLSPNGVCSQILQSILLPLRHQVLPGRDSRFTVIITNEQRKLTSLSTTPDLHKIKMSSLHFLQTSLQQTLINIVA